MTESNEILIDFAEQKEVGNGAQKRKVVQYNNLHWFLAPIHICVVLLVYAVDV